MKTFITFLFTYTLLSTILWAQAPVTQVEGFLEVYIPEDMSSLYIGQSAGQKTSGTFRRNTFVGNTSGQENETGIGNSFFGRGSGRENISGDSNSFFGSNAGLNNESGNSNSFFGSNAGIDNETGDSNSFFGLSSGLNNESGNWNSFFGVSSGREITSGQSNSFFGIGSGQKVTTQNNIIAIGAYAGPTSEGAIGSRLYIDIEESDTPLIYGDFVSDKVTIYGNQLAISDDQTPALRFERSGQNGSNEKFDFEVTMESGDLIFLGGDHGTGAQLDTLVRFSTNGTITAAGAINGTSDVNKKEFFEPIDNRSILDKIVSLPITEWQYKTSPDRHIGPMAQDFYAAFGLGQGETTIATVDADGVALAAIQALAQENANLNIEITTLGEENKNIKLELQTIVDHNKALETRLANLENLLIKD